MNIIFHNPIPKDILFCKNIYSHFQTQPNPTNKTKMTTYTPANTTKEYRPNFAEVSSGS